MTQYSRPERNVERARKMRRSMTSAETTVWSMVRRRQLGWRFRRQEPIGPYIVDFVCWARRLVVEMDGDGHGGTYDLDRDTRLGRMGLRVLHFDNDDLAEINWVRAEILSWLADMNRW